MHRRAFKVVTRSADMACMRAPSTTPTGVERRFGDDEIIVTKTDPKGVITYANDVFLRVSAMREADVLGQPHNLIRHPAMPRGVFDLLWETLREGREMFALVLNLAADGAHYWVLAHVTPSTGASGQLTGYHSSRRVPPPAAVAAATALYAEMLREESRHSRPAEAVRASRALLEQRLAAAGRTYEEFVWSLLPAGAAA